MTSDEEQPKRKMDIFDIGIYAIEIGLVAVVVYAMIVLPTLLKPVAS